MVTMADVDAAYEAYCRARESSVQAGWVESNERDSAWAKFVEMKTAYWREHNYTPAQKEK